MCALYWFGFQFLFVPVPPCAAEDGEKALAKKTGYSLMAGTVLGILVAFILTGTLAVAQESHFSELWDQSGERWSPRSRLPDFSFAGYRAGEQPIPSVKQSLNVRDFGARGDGKTDNTRAFKEAIARCHGEAIFIPPGRYVISGILSITKSGVVFRGAGQRATTLHFARSLEDILGTEKVPYWGGLIDVSGENRGQAADDDHLRCRARGGNAYTKRRYPSALSPVPCAGRQRFRWLPPNAFARANGSDFA